MPDAIARIVLETLLAVALAIHGVPEQYDFAACIVEKESNWQVDAVGQAGEIGLAQVMPSTGEWWAEQLGWEEWDPERLYKPSVNLYLLAYGLANGYEGHWTTARLCEEGR